AGTSAGVCPPPGGARPSLGPRSGRDRREPRAGGAEAARGHSVGGQPYGGQGGQTRDERARGGVEEEVVAGGDDDEQLERGIEERRHAQDRAAAVQVQAFGRRSRGAQGAE